MAHEEFASGAREEIAIRAGSSIGVDRVAVALRMCGRRACGQNLQDRGCQSVAYAIRVCALHLDVGYQVRRDRFKKCDKNYYIV
ncbi:hypothetical protein BJV78DRAFT_1234448 [Lactifluus subvellereus]|nr:hypothetical protein BJV78DRAFT_1234448 [Lactifluus subvellereus]